MSKAVGKVLYHRLSSKLEFYGIQTNTKRRIDCFLAGRSQTVVVQDAASDSSHVTSGVSQGTDIGPFLLCSPKEEHIVVNLSHCLSVRLFVRSSGYFLSGARLANCSRKSNETMSSNIVHCGGVQCVRTITLYVLLTKLSPIFNSLNACLEHNYKAIQGTQMKL